MIQFKCPVCHAKFKENPICSRCKTDLSPLISTIDQAIQLYNQALTLTENNHFQQALSRVESALKWYNKLNRFHQLKNNLISILSTPPHTQFSKNDRDYNES